MLRQVSQLSNFVRLLSAAAAKGEIPSLNFQQLQTLMKSNPKMMLVDVREPKELTSDGKIPMSMNIPLGELRKAFLVTGETVPDQRLANIPKPELISAPIVLHCKLGMRAMKGAKILQQLGYKDVRTFPGGVKEWNENTKKN